MDRSSIKLKLLSGLICLVAAVFALDTVSFGHVLADQSQTEAVEIDLEEYVALDQRRGRQKSLRLRQRFVRLFVCCGGAKQLLRLQRLSAPIATERSRLNGFGGFLRT